jgi:hypothetical protein
LYYKHFTGHSVKYCKYKKDQIQSKWTKLKLIILWKP